MPSSPCTAKSLTLCRTLAPRTELTLRPLCPAQCGLSLLRRIVLVSLFFTAAMKAQALPCTVNGFPENALDSSRGRHV
jgi:hypothetical protein